MDAEQPTVSELVDIDRETQEAIDAAAADWTARLGGAPLSDAERHDLAGWLAADPAHEAALAEARAVWQMMGALPPDALAQHDGANARATPANDISPGPAGRRRWAPVAAVAACLAFLVVLGGTWLGDPMLLLNADYRTRPGEQRQVTLSDGSEVTLGPDSAMAVAYSQRERRIDLLAGVAYFKAAPMGAGEPRPFAVEAEGGTAKALGTEFMVERLAEDVRVTVAVHRVAVSLETPPGQTTADPVTDQSSAGVTLGRGQSVRYSHDGIGSPREVDPAQAAAWRRGRLIFDDVALSDVVTALNRYRRNRAVILDPTLAARKVSGIFQADQADLALATIARDLGVGTATLPGLVTLLY